MQAYSAPKATILLLDSEPVMRAVLRDALEEAGYQIVAAGDLGEAIDRLAEMRFDLLITRPYINSMPGRIAAEYLRNKQHGLPVLTVAGFMNEDRVRVISAIEEFHIFPKPFNRNDLLVNVGEVLEIVRKKG